MTAVLGIQGRGRTTFCRPVSSGGLGSPPAGPYGGPGRLRTLLSCDLFENLDGIGVEGIIVPLGSAIPGSSHARRSRAPPPLGVVTA